MACSTCAHSSSAPFFSTHRLEVLFTALTLPFMVLGWWLGKSPATLTAANIFFLCAYITGGWFGLGHSLRALLRGNINVDILMIAAALGAAYIGAPFEGAMLLFLFSLSHVLQDFALGRTKDAIRALMKLRPTEAHLWRAGETVLVPVEELTVGDEILVRPGERVPLDGEVVSGSSDLDQSSLTGESMPIIKNEGDVVFAGTINGSGALRVRITKLAADSTIAKLIHLVEEAQSERAPTQHFVDRFERWYASGVLLATLLLIAIPLLLKYPFDETLYRAITLMVVASPCALIISTPASILSAIANGARKGVLFKGGAHLENAATIKIIAIDKTGTLTHGKPVLTDVSVTAHSSNGAWRGNEDDLLALAAAVEQSSEHPLAQAIVKAARERQLTIPDTDEFLSATGKGVRARMGTAQVHVGNPRYFKNLHCTDLEPTLINVERLQDEGKTSVLVGRSESEGQPIQILGALAIADTVRRESIDVVRALKKRGIGKVVMLTGDNHRVARAVAAQTGVDEYFAELLPEDKVHMVKELKQGGKVAMVGDGVNDAPALATADMGVAMGAAGSDVALETADMVLMGDNLYHIPYAIALSHQARRVVVQNLTFSLAVIIVLIAGALGWKMPLTLGVIAHEGSTLLVCLNGLRLLIFRHKTSD